MELVWLATESGAAGTYGYDLGTEGTVTVVDMRPLIAGVVSDVRQGCGGAAIARRFHSTLVEIVATVCDRLRRETGLRTAALSGGVFLNALLTTEVSARLERHGFQVLRHRRVPPNDGGLSLGQLAVAAALDISPGTTSAPT
jgi:hydrogenase maturation protein HypF